MELRWRQTLGARIAALPEHADERGMPLVESVEPAVIELCILLLGHDGIRVCVPFGESPEWCRWFIEAGLLHRPGEVELRPGRDSDCHGNSARLWLAEPATHQIVTGYALSEDDRMWRRHSWVLDAQQQVIETTEVRCLYYGIRLEPSYAQYWTESYL